MRVILADDEAIERKVIEQMLIKKEDGLTILHAKNGREAVKLHAAQHADVIFMDIKMPGMDGLMATDQIKQMDPNVEIIMVSAYDTFHYAKRAIEYGVKAYLLKPTSVDEVYQVFDKVTKQLHEKMDKNHEMTQLKRREWFVSHLLSELGDEEGNESVAVAIVDSKETTEEALLSCFQADEDKVIVGPKMANYIPIAIMGLSNLEEGLSLLKKRLLKDSSYRFGLGGLKHDSSQLIKSYEEALISYLDVANHESARFSCYKENSDSSTESIKKQLVAYTHQLINAMDELDKAKLLKALDSYCFLLAEVSQHKVTMMKRQVYPLLYRFETIGIDPFSVIDTRALEAITHKEGFRRYLKSKLIKVFDLLRDKRSHQSPLDKAKRYIDNHYSDTHLSLEEVASEVKLSVYYLSKSLKDYLGMSYVDYIRDKRMKAAKGLLKDTSIPLKAVAIQVGYSDPNYFSRLFKKQFGLTPTAYREAD
ncbi:response regulator [Amphibacillus cookii]|uniref:response regulator n=1 Tax=Amphibacillus cookii TaxID=767787 RepID=UPI00195BC190|nr:response regulator [Amphibacillus cookii]MBM7539962.1 two-component system response regulator YesN [Amphibacillus cookii]